MILIVVFAAMAAGIMVGLVFGHGLSQQRSAQALKARRYSACIRLLADLVNEPDAINLRERANKILVEHHKADSASKE